MFCPCVCLIRACGALRDLLLAEGRGKPLDLREDGQRGTVIAGLSTHAPKGADEVFDLLARGNRNRSQCATDANSESSRSHGVFQIIVTHRDKAAGGEGGGGVRVSKLSMIDLAGSERASVSKNQGAVLREGANINRSLLALGNCINALASGEAVGFVPYRDSKLTRLLKDSLGGNTRTVMIAAVSPSSLSHEDTHNTLQYANRAKNIKVRATKNEHSVEFHVSQYAQLLAEQRAQILDLQTRLSTALGSRATQHRALSEEQQQHLVAAERAVNERVLAFGEMQDAISAQYEDELRVRKRLRRAQLVASLQDAKLPLAPLVFGSGADSALVAIGGSASASTTGTGPSVRSVENEAHDARAVLAQRQHGLVAWQAELRAWMRGAESALPGARQQANQQANQANQQQANGEDADPTQLGADARALLEAKADALVAKTTASALEARLTVRQHEIAYLHDQVVAARTDAAHMWALNKQVYFVGARANR